MYSCLNEKPIIFLSFFNFCFINIHSKLLKCILIFDFINKITIFKLLFDSYLFGNQLFDNQKLIISSLRLYFYFMIYLSHFIQFIKIKFLFIVTKSSLSFHIFINNFAKYISMIFLIERIYYFVT